MNELFLRILGISFYILSISRLHMNTVETATIEALGLNEGNMINSMEIRDLDNKFRNGRITIPECQREGKAWNLEKKRKFIDSILRGYQIPVFYFFEYEESGQDKLGVYDGQQRIESITGFMNNEFPLASTKNFTFQKIKFSKEEIQDFDEPVYYRELIDVAAEKIMKTLIHYYKLPPLPDAFLDDTFIRLQEAKSLTGVEKRMARTTNQTVQKIKEVVPLIDEHKKKNLCFEYISGRAISYALAEQAVKLTYELRVSGNRNFGSLTSTELKELYKKEITPSDISKTQTTIRKMISILNFTDLLEKSDSKFISNKFIPFFLTVRKLGESTAKEKEKEIRAKLFGFLHELDKVTLAHKDSESPDLTPFDNRAVAYYEASQAKGTDQYKNIKVRYENMHNFIITNIC